MDFEARFGFAAEAVWRLRDKLYPCLRPIERRRGRVSV